MTESSTQTEMDNALKSANTRKDPAETSLYVGEGASDRETSTCEYPIIWTPGFITTFALVLVIGLSTTSLLTQGWLNGYYTPEQVLLAFLACILGGWLTLAFIARSPWIRLGAGFGCAWVFFAGMNLVATMFSVDVNSPIIAQINAATNSALLGSYICLSIDHTPFRRWDRVFFRFAPLLAAILVATIYFLSPPPARQARVVESSIAGITLYLCLFVWWARPSCWQVQPGPTLLFGLLPITQLLLAIPKLASGESNFFFLQVTYLWVLLGILRLSQYELKHRWRR